MPNAQQNRPRRTWRGRTGLLLGLLLLTALLPTLATAVPHIRSGMEPFTVTLGQGAKHLRAAPSHRAAGLPDPAFKQQVSMLWIRVDFTPDTDPETTGTGVWTDADYAHSNDPDHWVNKNKTALVGYYNEVSYGKLQLGIDVSPQVYRLAQPMEHYGDESDTALENLIVDAVKAADADHDFKNYDVIVVVHAGPGEETDYEGNSTHDIWSLFYSDARISANNNGSRAELSADDIPILSAMIMPQTSSQDGDIINPLGVYAHEFAHWLGLPDLYDTSGLDTWDGVGRWSLMGSGIYLTGTDGVVGSAPAHLDAWSKIALGWATPRVLGTAADPGTQTLIPVEDFADIIQIPAGAHDDASLYYLLEYRRRSGYDYGLPDSGILVWVIDEGLIKAGLQSNTLNNNPRAPAVQLLEADGDGALALFGDDDGSAGDPYANTSANPSITLTPHTTPSTVLGTANGLAYFTAFTNRTSIAQFHVGYAPARPQNVTRTSASGVTLNWTAATDTDFKQYRIYKNDLILAHTTSTQYADGSGTAQDRYAVATVDQLDYVSPATTATIPAAKSDSGGGGACAPEYLALLLLLGGCRRYASSVIWRAQRTTSVPV